MEFNQTELFTITCNIKELRIICKALGGRLYEEEDRETAKFMDIMIAEARIDLTEQKQREMLKLKNNLSYKPTEETE